MVNVKKLNGDLEPYNEEKLRKSLYSSGADEETATAVLEKVKAFLYEGIETKVLYKFVLKEFKSRQPMTSARYALKNAILQLGPDGFPFEVLIGEIFKKKGYTILVDQHVQGKLIDHEIDVVAEKQKEKLMVECKYHIKPWTGTSIHTALYVYARFLDVQERFTAPFLITNTKFSPQIITYATGVGLKLMGWKYPPDDSLERNIESFKLYPITMLHSIDGKSDRQLLSHKIVLVQQLAVMARDELSQLLAISPKKATRILDEAKAFSQD
ncbi:MAG: restriction endonuclease [archaeon]